ncbi:aldo/keto reductase [Thermasporomyces composti]|uniref:Diketogulonate reductase-like aldo/keto reductase n=1 Tax=Thermasporomyces composti TaxID=696763 RepID=A0A3D9V6P9_THECX|nr:aldo/keto reductase [Thermasporomyces composti]REF37187.1 diketogulonate reductase-like aldo/keto reductase [Thermasporomyces composti]
MSQPYVTLNNGVRIPQIGFGVFQVPPETTQSVVERALEAGYRHIDTAAAYNNEAGVGAAVRASGLPRDQVFITTKLRNGEQGYDSALKAYDDSLARLGLDYADLYLIHWPNPAADKLVDSWRALERIYHEGRVRAIGVSNFLPEHLDRVLAEGTVVPAVNQIELHPTYQQRELASYCQRSSIAVEAYSPLGRGQDLDNPVVSALADKHGVSPAQVVLRWHLQRGHIVIPKSISPDRIRSNIDLAGFNLTPEEMASITALESGNRTGNDPRTFSLSQIR